MPRKYRFIGWAVMSENLDTGRVRFVHACATEEQARREVRTGNATIAPPYLFFAEWWSTASVLDTEHSESTALARENV